MSEIRYGTAGWSFPDWYGPFYPTVQQDDGPGSLFSGVPQEVDPDVGLARKKPLVYYARYFDTVEVNSSFYGIPKPSTTTRWLDATERREGAPFQFSFKLPMQFTHHRDLDPRRVEEFAACLAPVIERGRLAAALAQFPFAFSYSVDAREHLQRIRALYPDLPLVAEVRHASWDCADARALLADLGVTLASIDQPLGRNSLGPTEALTNPELAYVRLHGRNREAWFDPKAGRDQKYDYLYSEHELQDWGKRIDAISGRSKKTLVIGNNHFRGQAPANVLELRARREPVQVPRPLRKTYGRLARIEASSP